MVRNDGDTPLGLAHIFIGGPDRRDFNQTSNCARLLASGQRCSIYVTFAPLTKGLKRGFLHLAADTATEIPTVRLQGIGTSRRRHEW